MIRVTVLTAPENPLMLGLSPLETRYRVRESLDLTRVFGFLLGSRKGNDGLCLRSEMKKTTLSRVKLDND
jgi:hypothetical protein